MRARKPALRLLKAPEKALVLHGSLLYLDFKHFPFAVAKVCGNSAAPGEENSPLICSPPHSFTSSPIHAFARFSAPSRPSPHVPMCLRPYVPAFSLPSRPVDVRLPRSAEQLRPQKRNVLELVCAKCCAFPDYRRCKQLTINIRSLAL
jgi:hypothetical protein